jgi:hypothetical protein
MLKSVERLIVVAAPSCCGKTVFLAHLSRGAIPQIAAAIGVDDVARWRICDAMRLPELRQEQIDCLIVAYAIPAHEVLSGSFIDPSCDARLNIVSIARETAFVTLLASAATMTSRLRERHRSSIKRIFLHPRKFSRTRQLTKRLLPIYRDPEKLHRVYDWWFKYTALLSKRGDWVVNAEAKYVLRGWFRRMTSTSDGGMWVANADAKYVLHDGASWSKVLKRINANGSNT